MITGVLVGAGAVFVIGVVVAAVMDREVLRVVAGFLVAVLVAPVAGLAWLLQRTGVGAHRLDGESLGRFARMRRKGGGQAFVLFYGRRGWVSVRGLRDNEPVPPVRVRVRDPGVGEGAPR